MPTASKRLPDLFYIALEQALGAHPEGLSEYELIKALRGRNYNGSKHFTESRLAFLE